MNKRLRAWLAALLGGAAMVIAGAAHAGDVPESDDPIIIGINEWTGQHITAYIAGHILEKMGYNVEFTTAAVFPMATAMADGNITLGLEYWDNNMGEWLPSCSRKARSKTWATSAWMHGKGGSTPSTWRSSVPGSRTGRHSSAARTCFPPQRPSLTVASSSIPPTGAIGPLSSSRRRACPSRPFPAGSEGALVAEFKAAVDKESALVMMFWAPHWLLFEHESGWVDMPEDLVNKGSMQKPRVFKTGWPGMKDKWPVAYKFIVAYQLNNGIQEYLMGRIDRDGEDVVKATREWVEANQDYWQPIVDEAMM